MKGKTKKGKQRNSRIIDQQTISRRGKKGSRKIKEERIKEEEEN
jgi:hypothetical protein